MAVEHRSGAAFTLDGNRFRAFSPPGGGGFDARFDPGATNFTASDDRLYMLDAWGGLWHAREEEPPAPLAPPDGGPGPRHAREASLVWDRQSRRLVLFGDRGENDTWTFDGSWRELRPRTPPPPGPGRAVATPAGVHLLVGEQLWVLADDEWTCLLLDHTILAHRPLFDPRRGRLLTVGNTVAVLDRDGFRHVAAVPPTAGATDEMGIDPIGDRLVRVTDHGVEDLALSSLVLEAPRRRDSDTWLGTGPIEA